MRRKLIFVVPLGIGALLLFIAVGGWLVMLLWNWLLPALFGWRQITLWQAVGLLALCRILFGGLGRHGWSHRDPGRRMAARWGRDMTPEERERIRQGLQNCCGIDPPTAEGGEP